MDNMPMFKRNKIVEDVFSLLKNKILSGELKRNNKLPAQDELVKQLGVSRTVVREAINKLSSLGMVSCEQGRGTFITIPDTQDFLEPMIKMLSLDDTSNVELIETRFYLEKATARLAAMKAGSDDIIELEAILKKLEVNALANRQQDWAESDLEFHIKLGAIGGNRIMKAFLDTIRDATYNYLLKLSFIPSEVDASIKNHRDIFDAVKAGDSDLAEAKMIRHFDFAIRVINENIHYELKI